MRAKKGAKREAKMEPNLNPKCDPIYMGTMMKAKRETMGDKIKDNMGANI